MALSENPNLALIPSGYKSGKIYSVLPTSGVGDFDFSRSGTATRINSQGLIETVADGVPRLNYPLIDGKVVGCPSHLLEPQRTNLITYSEDFSDSSWVKTNCTINSNNAISPDGTQNADKLDFTTSNGEIVRTTTGFVVGQEYTMSFYAKTESGTLDFTYGNMDYSAINGTATNEWQRFVITQTLPVTTRYPKIQTTEIGSLLLWGFQVEQSSFPTSYIPSLTGSETTRSAETANNSGDASTFNDSEGVLMLEVSSSAKGENRQLGISDGSSSDRVIITLRPDDETVRFYYEGTTGGSTQIDSASYNFDNTLKIAGKYKSGDIALWVNGFEVGTSTSAITASGLNVLDFYNVANSALAMYSNTKQIQYYDSALTDSELETLTSWVSFSDMAEGQLYSIK